MVEAAQQQTTGSSVKGAGRTPYENYKELLDDSLNKIAKTVSKSKNKDLIVLALKAIEQVQADQNEQKLSANKYFYIFKMAIESKLPRLVEQLLYRIQKLFSYDFLDGDCPDNCRYEEGQQPPAKNGKRNRLLIDAIVETICKCSEDRDNAVQLEVIKTLLSITIAANSKVHERTLMEAFKTQYSIHLATNSSVNRNTAKAALTQMVNAVFAKMDTYQKYGYVDSLDLMKLYGGNPVKAGGGQQQNSSRQQTGSQRSLQVNQQDQVETAAAEETKDVNSQRRVSTLSTGAPGGLNNSLEVTFANQDQYVYGVVQNMVDSVCLYEARVDALQRESKQAHPSGEQASNSGEADQVQDTDEVEAQRLRERVSSLQLNPVDQGVDDYVPTVEIQNEMSLPAGRFGWCIVCRNTANIFDTETQHPVCSTECQKKHMVECSALDSSQDGTSPNFVISEEAETALQDAILVFRSIVKLSVEGEKKPESDKQISYYVIRAQIIGLELILAILEKPKPSFLAKKEFIWIIKNHLCDGLLRYSVSNEREIFSLVVSIFFCLFTHFRKYLKNVIKVFLETIFLKLLESSNTSYHHKHLILSVFDKISQNTMMLLEIFINYDCDVGQLDISKQIVESLSKIANGKLAKTEHKSMINSQEELTLRSLSVQILVSMLRSFNGTIDAEMAESKVSQRLIRHQTSHLNNSQSQTITQGSDQDTQGDAEVAPSVTPAAERSATSALMTSNKFEVLQNQRVKKTELNKAANKFNFKWKNGIKYLTQANLILDAEQDYKSHVKGIVNFLKNEPSLDKTKIGEFMGVDADLNKACLAEFINQYDLKDMPFVQALRTVLLGFRLPGEGQIVDRVMECFGEKFVSDNPKGSDQVQGEMSAECVFLLSYATMMMQTSLHNPNAAKSRMTVEDFGKMIKGINSQKNLEPAFIQIIYDTVEREPFTLNEDEDARIKQETAAATSYQRKQELFQKMGMGLIERGKSQISQKSNEYFLSVDDSKPIKPLFENIWPANLSTLSVILEKTNDQNTAALCIEGFAHSIKICGYFNMKDERDAFVASLAKFSQIGIEQRIKNKNILVIQKILELATFQGNYLGESWQFVLDCISKLEEMINLGQGQMRDSDYFETNASQSKNKNSKESAANKAMREQNRIANCELIVQNIEMAQIDQIFQSSLNLDQDAIIMFIENLCKVSRKELDDPVNARKFSLQALVEIADLNMARIRFVWTRIWQMLSEHFVHVGSHENLNVSIFAIDSLRQLADKFLIKEEFASFNFQKDFLKPFEQIMLHNLATRTDIKEYIVMCITNICRTKTAYIKSGWSVIINIFTLAAQDSEEMLVQQSFYALKIAVTEKFSLLENNFVELVNCFNKYSMNSMFNQQSQEAQRLLLVCAQHLKGNDNLINFFLTKQGNYFYQRDLENMSHYPPQYGLRAKENKAEERKIEEEPTSHQQLLSVQKGLWFPILTNLTNLALDKANENQLETLEILFQVLQQGVEIFSLEFWREILSQVLFPMLEDIDLAIQTPSRRNDDKERTFYLQTIQSVVQGFNDFLVRNLNQLCFIVPTYADILVLFISQTQSRRIIQVMIVCFQQFMQKTGEYLSTEMWQELIQTFSICFEKSMPQDLMEQVDSFISLHETKSSDASEGHKESFRKRISENEAALEQNLSHCLVQLFVVNTLKDALDSSYEKLSVSDSQRMLETLQTSYEFSKQINLQFNNCIKLQRVDQMAGLQLFRGLVSQEYRSLAAVLTLKFYTYFTPKDGQPNDNSSSLFSICSAVLQDYVAKESSLLDLKTEKLELAQGPEGAQTDGSKLLKAQRSSLSIGNANADSIEEAPLDGQISKPVRQSSGIADMDQLELHEGILVKQVQSLTPIIQKQILNNFQQLSDQHLQTHGSSLGPILIDLTLCNDFEIRAQNKNLLSKLFNLLTRSEGN